MISFVYFDLSGVLVTDLIVNGQWTEMKRSMGVTSQMDPKFEQWFDQVEPSVCIGRDPDSLVPEMIEKFGLKLPDNYSFINNLVSRFETIPSIWPVIKEIQIHCPVGIITNAYKGQLEGIISRGLFDDIKWQVIINSSTVEVAKPDPAIFNLTQSKAGVPVEQILFVDNSSRHINTAKALGWQTFLYDPNNADQSSKDLLSYFDSHK